MDTPDTDLRIELDDACKMELGLERLRLRNSFYEFVQAAWSIVEPEQPFTPNWHIEAICLELQDIALGRVEGTRFIFNVPPGTLKSLLISVFWPAWVWARNPAKRFLTASYGAHLTIRDNLRVRDIVQSTWFQELFPVKLVEDQNAKTRYNTEKGGWRIATSVGGVGTGEHPDYIIIDDPLTATQAESEQERTSANNWFDRTLSSRGMTRNVVVIVVMQRLHKEDLTGHLLDRGNVTHVCFPMRYVPTRPATDEDEGYTADPRDPRTQPGELLFPALFPEVKVKALERDLGPYGTAGQLQQTPSPEGGGLFKAGWFKFLDALPATCIRGPFRGWDTAATEGDGDYMVGVKMLEFEDGKFLVCDVVRDQVGPAGGEKLLKSTADMDGVECGQREEKEGGASGKIVIDAHAKLLVGYDYKGVLISGSKVTRAKPFRSQCEAGNVYLLRAPWNQDYIRELCAFPTGANDDQVDGSSCSFNSLILEPKKVKARAVWGAKRRG